VIPESWASEFLLGTLLIKDVPISKADAAYVQQAEPGEKVIAMGLAGLARLELYLDPQNQVAYCRPSPKSGTTLSPQSDGRCFRSEKRSTDELIATLLPAARPHSPAFAMAMSLKSGSKMKSPLGELIPPSERPSAPDSAWYERAYSVRRGDAVTEVTVIAKDILVARPR